MNQGAVISVVSKEKTSHDDQAGYVRDGSSQACSESVPGKKIYTWIKPKKKNRQQKETMYLRPTVDEKTLEDKRPLSSPT